MELDVHGSLLFIILQVTKQISINLRVCISIRDGPKQRVHLSAEVLNVLPIVYWLIKCKIQNVAEKKEKTSEREEL